MIEKTYKVIQRLFQSYTAISPHNLWLGSWAMRLATLMLCLLCIAQIANADDEWDFSKPYRERCDNGGLNTMGACVALEHQQVDKRLNDAYTRLSALLADNSKLKKAQNAWIKFRNLSCEYETSGILEGGGIYPLAYNSCLIDITEKRIRDIKRYLEWDCNGCPTRK